MLINEITLSDCQSILGRASIARLGCSLNNQPYVVPVCIAYESEYAYVLSTPGRKIEYMRANPKACLEVEEITDRFHWKTVIAYGEFQELRLPQYEDERAKARKLLARRSQWWLNALAQRQMKAGDELIQPIFFRIRVDSMTGFGTETEDATNSVPQSETQA